MLFKKDELQHLWSYYLYRFIIGLSFMLIPYLTIYFLKEGCTFFQISVTMFANRIAIFLFEVPTGAFADSYSRKYSVIMGLIIVSIAVTLIPFTKYFGLITFLWVIVGIGMAFISGAAEAMVIDNLNQSDRKDLYQECFIKSNSFSSLGSVFASIIGAILVEKYSMRILWFVFGAGYFVAALIFLFFTKENFTPLRLKFMHIVKKSYRESKKGLHFSFRHKTFLLLIFAGLIMELMFLGIAGIQPFLVSLGMSESQLGYMYSINSIVGIGISFLSRGFSNFKFRNVMSITILIHMTLLISFSFIFPSYFYLAAFVFIAIETLYRLVGPLLMTHYHNIAPARIRATVMSVASMMTGLVMGLAALVSGHLLDLFGPRKILAYGSVFGILAIYLYQKIKD